MSYRVILTCSIALLALAAGVGPGIAQTVPAETVNCRLEGNVTARFVDEEPETSSAKCLESCLSSSTNLADPNRCTGYHFIVNSFSATTGYTGPIIRLPNGQLDYPPRACTHFYGPLTFANSEVVPNNYSCILPCTGTPKLCNVHEGVPKGVGIKPTDPKASIDPASPSLRGPKPVPKSDALVKDDPAKDLDPNKPGIDLPPVKKPPR